MNRSRPLLVRSAAAFLAGAASLGAIDPPSGLLCDLMPDAEAPVPDVRPAFSWQVGPAEPASMQGAYQLQVSEATDAGFTAQGVWDSGKVASAASVAVRYGGADLVPGRTYRWRVQVWDRAGAASGFSPPAEFAVGAVDGSWPRRALITARSAPAVVTPVGGQGWVVDFGRDAFGWLEVAWSGDTAAILAIRLGEAVRPDGHVDPDPGGSIRSLATTLQVQPGIRTYRVAIPPDRRNTGKDAVRLPAGLGVVLPFRYAEIQGTAAAPVVARVAVRYPFADQAARFASDDPTLDAVWELSRYSIQATSFCGLYVDGDRERIAYEGDAYLNQLGHYATDREFAMARATYGYLLDHPTWPTEWSQCMVLIAWTDWMHTGDVGAVARTWDRLVPKALRTRMRADGLLDTRGLRDLVDWPAGERDHFEFRPVNTVVNAFHLRVHECLADLASALGRSAEAETYRRDAARIRSAFNACLFDRARGLYVDGEGSQHSSLHANIWPLAFGLVPPERVPAIHRLIERTGMACSVYGAQFLLDGLFATGRADLAIGFMRARGSRSWADMLAQGATITMEAWNPAAKPNLDWNHAWGAAPANAIPRGILGVRPLTAGSATLLIRPQLGPLTRVGGTVPTIRGPVAVAAERTSDGAITVTVTVPGNTQARVELAGRSELVGPGRHVIRSP